MELPEANQHMKIHFRTFLKWLVKPVHKTQQSEKKLGKTQVPSKLRNKANGVLHQHLSHLGDITFIADAVYVMRLTVILEISYDTCNKKTSAYREDRQIHKWREQCLLLVHKYYMTPIYCDCVQHKCVVFARCLQFVAVDEIVSSRQENEPW